MLVMLFVLMKNPLHPITARVSTVQAKRRLNRDTAILAVVPLLRGRMPEGFIAAAGRIAILRNPVRIDWWMLINDSLLPSDSPS
jgi:hypothetical protein